MPSGGFRVVPGVPWNPPLGCTYLSVLLSLSSILLSVRLNGTPLSRYRTKKTTAVAHLSMLQQKIHSKTDRLDW